MTNGNVNAALNQRGNIFNGVVKVWREGRHTDGPFGSILPSVKLRHRRRSNMVHRVRAAISIQWGDTRPLHVHAGYTLRHTPGLIASLRNSA